MRPQQHNQIQFAVAILLDDGIELFLPLFGVIEDETRFPIDGLVVSIGAREDGGGCAAVPRNLPV